MNKYYVILSDSKTLVVEAESFLLHYEKDYVKFYAGEKNTAFFNFSNILGFGRVGTVYEKD